MNRLFILFALIFLSAPLFAVTFKIDDIRLEGLQRVSASPVFAAMPVRVGETVDSADLRQVIRSLFSTGFFTNVQIARDGNILIIVLQERPAIKSISIDGNKAIKTEQLVEVMDDNDLREGEILQRHTLQGITRELERQYISRARYDASVEAIVKELPNNMVTIDIDVDEGSSAKIRHINIVGNNKYEDDILLDLFELGTTAWYQIFSSKDQYAKEKLTGDIETLESFYLDRGYLDFEVVSTQVSISPDKKSVYITLNISEGEVYTVSKIEIGGDPKINEARLRRLILLREGDTFSQKKMTDTSEYFTTLLGNSGYTNASVEGMPDKNEEDHTVKLNFFIDPGKRVYVRRVEFRGNTKTSDEVLRREMRQLEGASASNAKIEQSKVRLERLGFFKEVTVETKDVPGTTDLVDVEYSVEEQPSGTISASIGYGQSRGVSLGINVQQNNWLGTGKKVGFGVTKDIFQTLYNFSYNDPYFTPDGVNRGFNAFYRTRDYDKVRASLPPFSSDAYGVNVNFGYPVSEISRLGMTFGLIHQSVRLGPNVQQEIQGSPILLNNTQLVAYRQTDVDGFDFSSGVLITEDMLQDVELGFVDKFGDEFNSGTVDLSWSRFTLNRGILATRGNSQSLHFETTVPGSDMEYYKISYDAQAFQPLTRDLTLRFKTSLGYGDGYGKMDELPFFENYRAGGFGSVRGFERFSIGPKGTSAQTYVQRVRQNPITDSTRDIYIICEDPSTKASASDVCEPGKLMSSKTGSSFGSRFSTLGGNVLMEFSTELILPIPFVEDSRSMQLVAFVDAGNVFSTSCREGQEQCSDIDLEQLRSTAGFGFTWISAMGPMTFSFAKALQEHPGDEREVFQFSFGAGF